MSNGLKSIFFIGCCIVMTACGGGGGGGGGGVGGQGPGDDGGVLLTISDQDIVFDGVDGGMTPFAHDITAEVVGKLDENLFIVIEITESGVVEDVQVSITGQTALLRIFPRDPAELGQGTHQDTVRVNVCTGTACVTHVSGSPKTVNITYNVTYDENVTDTDDDGHVDADDDLPNDPTDYLDHDHDGTGNTADSDDDNDSTNDSDDAFPFDNSEWLDTDFDQIGNNADTNDDNDALADADDPLPLDNSAPGTLTAASPGFIFAGQTSKVILGGVRFSVNDSFFVNGEEVSATLISQQAAEIQLTPDTAGTIEIAIVYEGYPLADSSVELTVIESLYYPYAVIPVGGTKAKGYFDPLTQSLFVHNSSLSQLSKHQYMEGGVWETTALNVLDLQSMGLSRDNKTLIALKSDHLMEVDISDFSAGASHSIVLGSNSYLKKIEFDYANKAVITADFNGLPGGIVYDLNPNSDDYGTQSSLGFGLNDWNIGYSRDGRMMLLSGYNGFGFSGLTIYRPTTGLPQFAIHGENFSSAEIDAAGDTALLHNLRVYKANFTTAGTLNAELGMGEEITAADISGDGDFAIAADSEQNLYWFDTGSFADEATITPDHSVAITENVGTINKLVISDDGLTVFVLGSNKILVVPVWQITEDALGSPATCPAAGCADIAVATGVTPPEEEIVAPPFDSAQSPVEHISPTYSGVGHQYELLLTGTGFSPTSVVQFGDVVATKVRYISDTELRVMQPVLAAGTYQVTVDGHQTNAPDFTVKAQETISEHYWAIPGFHKELIYDPMQNVAYGLVRDDAFNYKLYRISLVDSAVTEIATDAVDVTWCPENDNLYVTTGTEVQLKDRVTLAQLDSVSDADAQWLECVAENKLFLAGGDFEPYRIFDIDQDSLFTGDYISNARVDGVSRRGDWLYIGASFGNSLLVAKPYQQSLSQFGQVNYVHSYWSADGSLGVVGDYSVQNGFFSEIDSLDSFGAIGTTAISPDGSKLYVVVNQTIHLIENPADGIASTTSHTIIEDIGGGAHRAVTSLDGNTVIVAGSNGIVAVDFSD